MSGFKAFILRGNVVDLAVAVVIGAAFAALVDSFTAAFITPLLGLFGDSQELFASRSFTVAGSAFPYGAFVQATLSFLIIAAVLYFLVLLPVNTLLDRRKTEPEVLEEVKQCPECLSKIPQAAMRCAFCTVEQPELV